MTILRKAGKSDLLHRVAAAAAISTLFTCGMLAAAFGNPRVRAQARAAVPVRVVIPIDQNSATTGAAPKVVTRSRAGVDGALIRVTTLAPDGPGSLRQALESKQPRLIVFEIGGVIDLGGRSLSIRSPHVTVAGQTAPDPGITIIRGSLIVQTYDAVIQHIAVRPGDGKPSISGTWAPDGLGAARGDAGPVHDVTFDHCSATWAVDENLSVSGPADRDTTADPEVTSHDVTLSHCLIAEALSHATHPKGEHSKGTLVHDGVRNVLITGCLYAHNRERNPRLKGGTRTVVAGNVMYDWGSAVVGIGAKGNRKMLVPAEAVVVMNVAIAGCDTRGRSLVKSLDPGGRAFLNGNMVLDASGKPLKLADEGVVQLAAAPAWATAIPEGNAQQAATQALRSAGARPARRDPIDARIVASVIRGDGSIIDSQEEVGGYPVRPAVRRALTVPEAFDARRAWLDKLSNDLSEDRSLDVAPLWKRLGITPK